MSQSDIIFNTVYITMIVVTFVSLSLYFLTGLTLYGTASLIARVIKVSRK